MIRYGTLLALVCMGCAGAQESALTETERASIRSAVEAQVQMIAEGGSQRNADLQTSIMLPDAEFVDFAADLSGTAAMRESWSELFARFQSFEFTWDEVEVRVLSRDWALSTATGTVRRQFVDGRFQETNPHLFMTAVFQLVDGEWKLARGHFSGSIRTFEDAP